MAAKKNKTGEKGRVPARGTVTELGKAVAAAESEWKSRRNDVRDAKAAAKTAKKTLKKLRKELKKLKAAAKAAAPTRKPKPAAPAGKPRAAAPKRTIPKRRRAAPKNADPVTVLLSSETDSPQISSTSDPQEST